MGISVSRVGGAAQVKAMKKVAGTLKLELAQFRDMQAFSMFASDLDPATRQQLTRGERQTELLKQAQYSPFPVEEQVVSLWAGANGHLDDVEVSDVKRFESEWIDHLKRKTSVLTSIASSGKLEDDTVNVLSSEVESFKRGFQAEEKDSLVGNEQAESMSADDIGQEEITAQNR